jgi:hypothetical protein
MTATFVGTLVKAAANDLVGSKTKLMPNLLMQDRCLKPASVCSLASLQDLVQLLVAAVRAGRGPIGETRREKSVSNWINKVCAKKASLEIGSPDSPGEGESS